MIRILLFLLAVLLTACNESPRYLFESLQPAKTGVDFVNRIESNQDFNVFKYRNFYNGGGVAIGDLNNDGLSDIYFTGNYSKNALYINTGDFLFDNVSEAAGVAGSKAWSTGVVLVDINNDGWLDIYVCNAGYLDGDDHQNELFINNGDLTFVESAEQYGLNDDSYTTHAAFFDYDRDGDLDVYLLNNSFIPVNTLNYSNKRELYAEEWPVRDFLKGGGDKLLRNDDGMFVDVTQEAGIYGSLIGFGLGVTVGDVNGDDYPDMYISNDFFERDYLYINLKNGTFEDRIEEWIDHMSLSSMGADMADINNDGLPEIFVTEMLPETDRRTKEVSTFENYNTFLLKQERKFYKQYMHNTLQLNNGDETFSEIGWYSGVAATDWSWGALIMDANNDGFKDLMVSNGVYQDVTDQDFIDFFANEVIQKMVLTGEKEESDKIIARMPSNPQLNKLFINENGISFKDLGVQSGFDQPSFSNGSAYGDLDNDGDLDLVVNNINQPAFVLRNTTQELSDRHYIAFSLQGSEKNINAIGSKISVYVSDQVLSSEVIPTRGFQSSVDYKQIIGLGESKDVDSIRIVWPDGQESVFDSVKADTLLTIDYSNTAKPATIPKQPTRVNPLMYSETINLMAHKEDYHIDFFQEGLVIKMLSQEGPTITIADYTGDGLDDLYMGGARGQAGQFLVQVGESMKADLQNSMLEDSIYEDTYSLFFDLDGDDDLDLFVGSGGNHEQEGSELLGDRLYRNDEGTFIKINSAFPTNGYNTAVAVPLDYDKDGDLDLFVGSRSTPINYGTDPKHFLYRNNGDETFTDVTTRHAPVLRDLGLITDAKLVDIDSDNVDELIVVGEWSSPQILEINRSGWSSKASNLDSLSGWWYALEAADLDGDGDEDLILGNRGENFYFSASADQPVKLWLQDFDQNGTTEKIITRYVDGKDKPIALKRELTEQLVSLKKQNLKHSEYALAGMKDLFSPDALGRAQVKESRYFKSIVAYNEGNGIFDVQALPDEVQFSCVCTISCVDVNGDGSLDVVLGGNDEGFLPQFSSLDASRGHVLLNKNGYLDLISSKESGFSIRGEMKDLDMVTINGRQHLIAAMNNSLPQLFKLSKNQ
ncbi:MAG: VCBS repeat-containing protein [Bacteroidota bacterium]